MRLLFDQGTPLPLRAYLSAHEVSTAFDLGWSALQNGQLLIEAERSGFDALLTTDQNLKYQQNLGERQIAIVVLSTTSWPRIERQVHLVRQGLEDVRPGGYLEIDIP